MVKAHARKIDESQAVNTIIGGALSKSCRYRVRGPNLVLNFVNSDSAEIIAVSDLDPSFLIAVVSPMANSRIWNWSLLANR
jgi:hypothetical protein